MALAKHEKRATDLAWETVDAKRDLQKVRMLLEEALDHIEDAEVLDRDYLNGCVSSALLICMGKKAAAWQVKKEAK
jgi:hypothetical protein